MSETPATASTENPDPAIPAAPSATPSAAEAGRTDADRHLEALCLDLRLQLKGIEQSIRTIKEHSAIAQPNEYPGQRGEMIAQSMLAVRHIEDARMRLGKVIQYGHDGVSVYDKP